MRSQGAYEKVSTSLVIGDIQTEIPVTEYSTHTRMAKTKILTSPNVKDSK